MKAVVQSELGYWNKDIGMWVPLLDEASIYTELRFDPGLEFNVNAWWMLYAEALTAPDLGTAYAIDDPSLLGDDSRYLSESAEAGEGHRYRVGEKVLALLSPGCVHSTSFRRDFPEEAYSASIDGWSVVIVSLVPIQPRQAPEYKVRIPETGEVVYVSEDDVVTEL
jgi:hypothetical protein